MGDENPFQCQPTTVAEFVAYGQSNPGKVRMAFCGKENTEVHIDRGTVQVMDLASTMIHVAVFSRGRCPASTHPT